MVLVFGFLRDSPIEKIKPGSFLAIDLTMNLTDRPSDFRAGPVLRACRGLDDRDFGVSRDGKVTFCQRLLFSSCPTRLTVVNVV